MVALNQPHDVYHLPGYIRAVAEAEGGAACAFYYRGDDGELFIPLIVRSVPGHPDLEDAQSPYGYCGPLVAPRRSELASHLFQQFRACPETRKLISVFLRLHPFLNDPQELRGVAECVAHGRTVYADLSLPLDSLLGSIRSVHRRHIKRLRQSGFRVAIDEWGLHESFIDVYYQTMRRVGAGNSYFFSKKYFELLRSGLPTELHLVSVVAPCGALAAGALLTECCGIVEYHLGGTADQFYQQSPIKLLFEEAVVWAKASQNSIFHFGGGLGGREDSLYHFKEGFASGRKQFHSARMVFDRESYDEVCCAAHPGRESSHALDGFFPAYRAA